MGPAALLVGVRGVLGPVAIAEAEEGEDAVWTRGLVDAEPRDHRGGPRLPDVEQGAGGQQVLNRLVVDLQVGDPDLTGLVLQTLNLAVYFLHSKEGNARVVLESGKWKSVRYR